MLFKCAAKVLLFFHIRKYFANKMQVNKKNEESKKEETEAKKEESESNEPVEDPFWNKK